VKKRIKVLFILALLSGVLCFGAVGALTAADKAAADDILGVYKNIETASAANTPPGYTVIVENKRFAEALKELPKDVLTGKGEPAVSINFKKGVGVKIVIKNVKNEYASLFSMYEDYVRFSGISKVQNPAEFKDMIDKNKIELQGEEKDFVVAKAWDPTKEQKDDSYALFYLDKTNWVIKKAVYFLDGVPYVEAANSYKNIGKWYVPYKIELKYKAENTSDVFLFKDYKFQESQ
jgi:hypothetical protein